MEEKGTDRKVHQSCDGIQRQPQHRDEKRVERHNVDHICYLCRGYRSRPNYKWGTKLWVGQRSISGRSALNSALSQKKQAEILGGVG